MLISRPVDSKSSTRAPTDARSLRTKIRQVAIPVNVKINAALYQNCSSTVHNHWRNQKKNTAVSFETSLVLYAATKHTATVSVKMCLRIINRLSDNWWFSRLESSQPKIFSICSDISQLAIYNVSYKRFSRVIECSTIVCASNHILK